MRISCRFSPYQFTTPLIRMQQKGTGKQGHGVGENLGNETGPKKLLFDSTHMDDSCLVVLFNVQRTRSQRDDN